MTSTNGRRAVRLIISDAQRVGGVEADYRGEGRDQLADARAAQGWLHDHVDGAGYAGRQRHVGQVEQHLVDASGLAAGDVDRRVRHADQRRNDRG